MRNRNKIFGLLVLICFSCSQVNHDEKLLYEKVLDHFIYGDLGNAPLVVNIKSIKNGETQEVLCPRLGFIMSTNFDNFTDRQINLIIDSLVQGIPITVNDTIYEILTDPYKKYDYNTFEKLLDSIGINCLLNISIGEKIESQNTCYYEIAGESEKLIFKNHYLFKKGFLIHSEHTYEGGINYIERIF